MAFLFYEVKLLILVALNNSQFAVIFL